MPAARDLRILFAGTPQFAVAPFSELLAHGFAPIAVFTQPDRPAGRGREQRESPVKQAACLADVPVHQPSSLRDEAVHRLVASLDPDLMVVVAYGLLLPPEILSLPTFGCWNIHASLLPRWRGAAPIQRAIEAGDRETGVSIMQMDEGLDSGPVMHREPLPLDGSETAATLHDRLSVLGAKALLACLHRLASGERPPATAQPEDGVSYARKLDKKEAELDWSAPAEVLERRVRAFNPWPVAWCLIGSERTRIWATQYSGQDSAEAPGTVLAASSQGIDVATGRGTLRLLELQPPGKRRMSAADYLNARSLPARLRGRS
jgi:methionyl-tRNA formyltransferase